MPGQARLRWAGTAGTPSAPALPKPSTWTTRASCWNHQMNTRRDFLATAAVAPLLAAIAPGAQAGATTVAAARLQGFPLSSVRLLPGPFEAAQSLDARYLL